MAHISCSTLILQPGLYILRHPGKGQNPLSISRAPTLQPNPGQIETLATPDTHDSILRHGGDCIVMQVTGANVELLVSACLNQPGAALPSLRVDRIALDAGATAAAPVAVNTAAAPAAASGQAAPIVISPTGISLVGHIESAGDVAAGEGLALGDPAGNRRLEGFQVMWPDRPAGVDIAYGIAVEGIGNSPVVQSGKFCGTRGKARRITSVTFALVGPQAAAYALEGTAHFSGGFQMPVMSGVPLSGPSGMEHLTALSLRARTATVGQEAGNPWTESSRTTIFKASDKSESSARPRSRTAAKSKASKASSTA